MGISTPRASVVDNAAWTLLPAWLLLAACGGEGRATQSADTNRMPTISGAPATAVFDGDRYDFMPTASDPDGDPLTFTVDARPAWAAFDPDSGQLSGVPTPADVGRYDDISIGVTDGRLTNSLPRFSITVNARTPNSAPGISGTPPTSVQQGNLYDFTPTATDADGDALTFSVSDEPPWASFEPFSGRLHGTPGSTGTYADIVISVDDGSLSSSLPPFSITVTAAPGNSAPSISGSPPVTVVEGTPYSFTPTASDPDGDPLTFGISGQPAWATFDTGSGTLAGTPGPVDVGIVFPDITISVSDGLASVSLAPFPITVVASATGTATLSWTAPTTNADGSQLQDLEGYIVHWGTAPGTYTQSATIDNPGITTYVISGLAPGTYYIAIAAVDVAGNESAHSNAVSATVP